MKTTDGIVESVIDSPERDGALIISFVDTVSVGNVHKIVRWDSRTWPHKIHYRVVVTDLVEG